MKWVYLNHFQFKTKILINSKISNLIFELTLIIDLLHKKNLLLQEQISYSHYYPICTWSLADFWGSNARRISQDGTFTGQQNEKINPTRLYQNQTLKILAKDSRITNGEDTQNLFAFQKSNLPSP